MSKGYFCSRLIRIIFFVAVAFGIAGCTSNSQFRTNGLPAQKYLVGGGFQIEWTAPTNGTAHLVEENTARIVQSQYLEKGGEFEVSIDLAPGEFVDIFGISKGDAKFSLYFIPSEVSDK